MEEMVLGVNNNAACSNRQLGVRLLLTNLYPTQSFSLLIIVN